MTIFKGTYWQTGRFLYKSAFVFLLGVEKVEDLEDRIRAHYHLRKPWGGPDESGSYEVLYSTVETLPPTPRSSKS